MGSKVSKSENISPQQWIQDASAERVAQDFTNMILNGELGYLYLSFSGQQISAFHETFDRISSPSKVSGSYCDEKAFTSYLRHFVPQSFNPLITSSGPILFKIALRHAAYPFPPQVPATMNSDELLRAITMLTGRVHLILVGRVDCRRSAGGKSYPVLLQPGRSDHDVRRLIFQSLALGPHGCQNKHDWRTLTENDLVDVYAVVSRVQPRPNDKLVRLIWEEFRPMAARLSERQVPLEQLSIPRSSLLSLLQLFLALRLSIPSKDSDFVSSPQPSPAVEELSSRATALLRTFVPDGEDLTFEVFDGVDTALRKQDGNPDGPDGPDLFVDTPAKSLNLKMDMLQLLARVFEAFVDPEFKPVIAS